MQSAQQSEVPEPKIVGEEEKSTQSRDNQVIMNILQNMGFDPVVSQVLANELSNDATVKRVLNVLEQLGKYDIKSLTELPEPLRTELSKSITSALRRIRSSRSDLARIVEKAMELKAVSELIRGSNTDIEKYIIRLEHKIDEALTKIADAIRSINVQQPATAHAGELQNFLTYLMERLNKMEEKMMEYHEKMIQLMDKSYEERLKYVEKLYTDLLHRIESVKEEAKTITIPPELARTLEEIAKALESLNTRVSMLETIVMNRRDPLEEAARVINNVKAILAGLKELDTEFFNVEQKEEDAVKRAVTRVMSFINQLAKIRQSIAGQQVPPPPPPPPSPPSPSQATVQAQQQQQQTSQETQAQVNTQEAKSSEGESKQ